MLVTYTWPGFGREEETISESHPDAALPELSIVIPAYNEARRLPLTLQRLQTYLSRQPYRSDIVVVSNGSTDETDVVVREAMTRMENLRLLSIPERGKGIAVRTGVIATSGRVVLLCDADLSMPPECLARFLTAIQSADVVVGSREAAGARRYSEPRYRHVMGRIFNRLVQIIAVPGIRDTQCGFKAFRRAAADDLFGRQTLTGFGFDVEVLYLARKLGYRIIELGVEWHFDADTRVRPGADTLAMLREVFLIRFRDARGEYGRAAAAQGENRAG